MIFDRPNKAFHDFESSLARPATWPPTKHDVPTLWERAKAMFADLLRTAGSIRHLAQRYAFRRAARAEIVNRLKPVEKLVRLLIMIEAATFLLMTPEGARMRREAKLVAPPSPPAPPPAPHSTRILMPGWQTIAALRPRIDPRVVEREAREREQAEREALARAMEADAITVDLPGVDSSAQGAPDPADPATWRCKFPIIRWRVPKPERAPDRAARAAIDFIGEDTHFPVLFDMIPPEDEDGPDAAEGHPGAIAIARRIEALSRVLANPAAAIRQVARRLATIPHDRIRAPDMGDVATRNWRHGKPECWNAAIRCEPAIRALVAAKRHAEIQPPEPG